MAVYTPPDRVLASVGAACPGDPLLTAADRLHPLFVDHREALAPFGLSSHDFDDIEDFTREIRNALKDPKLRKNDLPLQMGEVAETLARIRGWLRTLRDLASINLATDTPALLRISSIMPELHEVYPRDLLEELRLRIKAAQDLEPRLDDAGLTRSFLERGRRLAGQLETGIGPQDLRLEDLTLPLRRLYMRKGQLYLLLKRGVRAAHVAFVLVPNLHRPFHLDELEPNRIEPAEHSVKPKGPQRRPR